jgi:WD40 repeat protein
MSLFSLIDGNRGNVPLPDYVERVYGEAELRVCSDVLALAFDRDGALWSVEEQGVLRRWSSQGRLQGRHYLSDLMTVWSFSAQAQYVAGGSDEVLIWDVRSGECVGRWSGGEWITALAWGTSGAWLASGHEDGSVRLWDVRRGQLLRSWAGRGQPCAAVAPSPDGTLLAAAGEDRHIYVWDLTTGELRAHWQGHPDRIAALTWSPDGRWLISAGWDSSARVWQVGQADPLMLLNSHAEQVVALAYSPDGRYLACADSDFAIHLWADPVQAQLAGILRGHADEVRCLAFSPDGQRLASASADGVILIWDVEQRTVAAGGSCGHRHRLACLAGERLRLASVFAGRARLWDAETGAPAEPCPNLNAYSVAASPEGRYLAFGGTDHFTHLYDLSRPDAPPVLLEATKPPIGQLAFAPDGRRLAHTSPADGLVWIWNTASAQPELILIEAADGCTLEGLCFHPDGQRLAAGGLDYLATGQRSGAVVVWHLPTREQRYVLDTGVTALAVDPQGRWWIGAGLDGQVYLWDAATGQETLVLPGPSGRLLDVACSPCGRYIAACGEDQTVRIWTPHDGQTRIIREMEMTVEALVFSPDGRRLFLALANGMACAVRLAAFLEE